MKFKLFCYLFLLIIILCPDISFAQNKKIQIKGVLIEQLSQNPFPYATIAIVDKKTNKQLSGTTSKEDGSFTLETNHTNFFIEISFIGYEKIGIYEFKIEEGKIDLGTILLVELSEILDEISVRAEKSKTEFKLDKRVFNVGKDLSSTGMSALELLNNVPSVTVNIEGVISLRGSSGVQILVDGKPSILADQRSNALGTITADMIDKIEVITNPSAKYDAEGTAGILNIILRKEEKKGLNGSISLNTGIPDNHSVGISLNRRTEKFNLFAQLGGGYRSLPSDSENTNRDLNNNTTVKSNGTFYRNEEFYNVILGTDYHINDFNVLTLSGNFAYEIEDQPSQTFFSYFEDNNILVSEWNRVETTEATNPKWQYELQYKKEYEDNKDHALLISALGRFFGKEQSSEFAINNTFGDTPRNDQQTETNFQQADYTFKLDYTKPFLNKITLETGMQYVINDVGNDYAVRDLIDDEWIPNEDLTNNFEYNQKVLGLYGTGAYEGEQWGVKLGLRMESTNLNTLLTNTNQANNQKYINFFPSAHTSYKFTDEISMQAGYSKRIYRPRLWDLNPFFNIRNDFNIRVGNPNLQPEYTDSYEITSIFIFEKTSINAGIHHLYTTDVIERVSVFEDNISTTFPINIGKNNTTGFEVNIKYTPVKWFILNGDFNYNYYDRKGNFEEQSFDFNGYRWSSRLTNKFYIPFDFELEITGNYQSGYQTVQSEIANNTYVDMGLRKKISKGKFVINLSIRDVFESRSMEVTTDQPEFYLYTYNQRGRFIALGISYGFGKGEAMSYSGTRR